MRLAAIAALTLFALLAPPGSAQEVRFDDEPSASEDDANDEDGARGKKERVPAARRSAEAPPLAIVGADIHPVTGPPIPGGTLLLRDGRIRAILKGDPRERGGGRALKGYEVLEAHGLRAYPGLVVPGADGLGLDTDYFTGAAADGLTRSLADSYDAWSDNLQFAASAGITTALVHGVPSGAKGPFTARAAVLKISPAEPRGVLVLEPAAVWAAGSVLTADGAHELRKALEGAREWASEPKKKRKDDPAKQVLLDVADGRLPVLISASSKADVTRVLELADELSLRFVLYQPTEAWVFADRLAAAGIPVVQHVRMAWGKARDDRRGNLAGGWRFDAPAVLHDAGVTTAVLPLYDTIMTWGVAGRDLTNYPLEAAFAQRGGLSAQAALEAITILPARLLGVDDRVGSLEVGKDADLILVDGDVLDYRAFVRKSIVNGRVVYDAETNRFWSDVTADRIRSLAGGG